MSAGLSKLFTGWVGVLLVMGCMLMAGCGRRVVRSALDLVDVPMGVNMFGSHETGAHAPPRWLSMPAFKLAAREVTVAQYCRWLNAVQPQVTIPPTIIKQNSQYKPRQHMHRQPIAHVSFDEATRYCAWLSARQGVRVVLPTEIQWEYAARAGVEGGRYPWGWGPWQAHAVFNTRGPLPVGSRKPNGFGLYDMGGNVYEWCRPPPLATLQGKDAARGGSWAEKDPKYLRVFQRTFFPRNYRNADVGFRICVEEG